MNDCDNPTVIEGESFCPVVLGPLQSPVAETIQPSAPVAEQLADTGLGADAGMLAGALLIGGVFALLAEKIRKDDRKVKPQDPRVVAEQKRLWMESLNSQEADRD